MKSNTTPQNKEKNNDKRLDNLVKWEKGVSGNPAGRPPKEFSMTNVMREVLNIEDKETRIKNYEAILIAAVDKAKAGDNDMIKYIINRLEGMPKGESTTNINVVIPILGGKSVSGDNSYEEAIIVEEEN